MELKNFFIKAPQAISEDTDWLIVKIKTLEQELTAQEKLNQGVEAAVEL